MTTSDKSQDPIVEKINTPRWILGQYKLGYMNYEETINAIMQLIAANNARVTTEILELLITEGYQHHERDMKLQNTMESMLQDINASRPTATGTEGSKQ